MSNAHLILELFVHLEEAARDEGSLQRMERVKVVFLGNGRVGKVRHAQRHSQCRMESLNAHTQRDTEGRDWVGLYDTHLIIHSFVHVLLCLAGCVFDCL